MTSPVKQARVTREDQPLQDFLAEWLSLSRNRAKALLDRRVVFVNGVRTWMARHTLRKGDSVELAALPAERSEVTPAAVLFEGRDYLVVNKPAGCLSNGPASAEDRLRHSRQEPQLRAAHRLDRDTTGCLLMARSRTAFDAIIPVFQAHKVVKMYHALVAGVLPGEEFSIDTPIDGTSAHTLVRVLDRSPHASHVAVRIPTGRTHQIRKHLAGIGHPVLGDKQYGAAERLKPELRHVERQMLHAASLRSVSPLDGAPIIAEAPIPADFRRWMKRLGLT